MKVCCVYSLESPHRGDSNEYTQYTIFNIKTKITLNYRYPKSAAMGFCSKGLKNEFETAMVKEPSVFEPLKFYCSLKCIESLICFYSHFSGKTALADYIPFIMLNTSPRGRTPQKNLPSKECTFFSFGGLLLQDTRKQTPWKECTQTPRNSSFMWKGVLRHVRTI